MSKYVACARLVRATVAATLGVATLISTSSALRAAEADAADAEAAVEEETLEEVQVTGTRIQNPNVTSANPISSISGEDIRALGIVNVADALTQLVPQNISTYTPTMVGDNQSGTGSAGMENLDRSAFFIGNTVANLRGLDPAFGSRTLTLVDGRRMPSTSNQADVVDMNIIPSNLLQRMDVVTGGASATYGSGAMAGVVNLVLNNRLQGLNLDFDYGVNEAGDGGSPHVSLSGGTALFNDRGHALFGIEWQDQQPIWNCATARTWCAESRAMFNNYTGTGQNLSATFTPQPGYAGYPARFEVENLHYSQFSNTGAITSTSTQNTSGLFFSADGRDVFRQAYGFNGGGGLATNGLGTAAMNGDGPLLTSGTTIRPESERKTFFANFEYDITERMTAYVQGNYSLTEAMNRQAYLTSSNCIRFQNVGLNGTNGVAGDVWINGTSTANGYTVVGTTTTYGQGPGGSIIPAKSPNLQSPGQANVLSESVRVWLGVPSGQSSGVQGNGYTAGPGGAGFQLAAVPASTVAPNYAVNAQGIQYIVSGSLITVPGRGLSQGGYPPSTNPQAATIPNINVNRGRVWPYWVPYQDAPNGPSFDFNGNARGKWTLVRLGPDGQPFTPDRLTTVQQNNLYTPLVSTGLWWALESLTLLKPYEGGTATILPGIGRDSNAFLGQLSPEALIAVQNAGSGAVTGNQAWGNGNSAGTGSGLDSLYGTTPCAGYTAMRKVWNPQVNQYTTQRQEPYRALLGLKGQFGGDWRYDAYVQYGKTQSKSVTHNAATNLRLAFATDAVLDDRLKADGTPLNPATYGKPICRITRDGPPRVDFNGRPVSSPDDLAELGANCQALNVFGDGVTGLSAEEQARQQAALAYAFVDSVSQGSNSLATLSVTTNGTLWQGWSGPLSGAFGLEVRQDKVANSGTSSVSDNVYERADLANAWADNFGGKTDVIEGYTEFDMPLVSGLEGLNLLSLNLGGRYAQYRNKGGSGTTGEERKQGIFNWKVQTVFEPFDFVRLRASRSQDLRTAGYRELFINQVGIPDDLARANPWRDRTAFNTENQTDRYGRIQVGNINLKPEKSGTLTLGMVMSPGGWAQGMRISADYFDITVKDAIGVPFSGLDPVTSCFENSGQNIEGQWDLDGNELRSPSRADFDYDFRSLDGTFPCREIQFGVNADGSRNLQDIVSVNQSRPQNLLPYQRRGIDISWDYRFPLAKAFENGPGMVSLNIRATRALEASGVELQSVQCTAATCNARAFRAGEYTAPVDGACFNGTIDLQIRYRDPQGTETSFEPNGSDFVLVGYNCIRNIDLVGQIRSSNFVPGVSASPKWSGNFTVNYGLGDLNVALNGRYVGAAAINKDWCDNADCPNYRNAAGEYLLGSVDNNRIKPYLNFSLSGSYNLDVGDLKQFQVFGSIANLWDKSPPFTGGGISGATANYHDILGRAYRMGVRMKF